MQSTRNTASTFTQLEGGLNTEQTPLVNESSSQGIVHQLKQIEFVPAIGGFIGAVATYVYYPLGAGFGDHVYTLFASNNQTLSDSTSETSEEASEIFFGTCCIIAMLALSILSSYDITKHIKNALCGDNTKELPSSLAKKSIVAASGVFGLFSISVRFYLTIKYLEHADVLVKIVLIPPSFIAPFAIGSIYSQKWLESIASAVTTNKYKRAIESIILSFDSPTASVDLFELDQSPAVLLQNALNQVQVSDEKKSLCSFQQPSWRGAFGYLGFIIGTAANYSFIQVVKESGDAFCDLIKSSSETDKTAVIAFFLIMFLVPSISLRGIATQNRFHAFFDFFQKNSKCSCEKGVESTAAVVLGFFAALPMTYLALESSKDRSIFEKLLVIPSFLSPFCVSAFSVTELINRYKKSKNTGSMNNEVNPNQNKEQLLQKLTKLKDQVSLIPEKDLDEFVQNNIGSTV